MIKRILLIFLLCASPLAVWAGNTDIVKDIDGNVIGQRRDAKAECDHLTGVSNAAFREWRQCVDEVDKHNTALSDKRSEADKEIIASRNQEAKKRRSLEDELNATQSTAAGMISRDIGKHGIGEYANTVKDAAGRAKRVGKRLSDMHNNQTDELKRKFDEFNGPAANSPVSHDTSGLYGSSRSAFDQLSSSPAPSSGTTSNAIEQYQTEKRADEERARIEEQRLAAERRLREAKERRLAEERAREQAEYERQQAAQAAAQAESDNSALNSGLAILSGIAQGLAAAANGQSPSTYNMPGSSGYSGSSGGSASSSSGGSSAMCQAEEQRVSNALKRINTNSSNMCQNYRSTAEAYELGAAYESRCGIAHNVAEYKRAASEARAAAAKVCN